jgi:hypothetical protein
MKNESKSYSSSSSSSSAVYEDLKNIRAKSEAKIKLEHGIKLDPDAEYKAMKKDVMSIDDDVVDAIAPSLSDSKRTALYNAIYTKNGQDKRTPQLSDMYINNPTPPNSILKQQKKVAKWQIKDQDVHGFYLQFWDMASLPEFFQRIRAENPDILLNGTNTFAWFCRPKRHKQYVRKDNTNVAEPIRAYIEEHQRLTMVNTNTKGKEKETIQVKVIRVCSDAIYASQRKTAYVIVQLC